MLRFFFKIFFLSFVAIGFAWLVGGAYYTYNYARAGQADALGSGFLLPKPAIADTLIKDTNFLLLGMSGKPYPAPYLTDTIIVGIFRTDPARLALVSIPRDLMVQVPGGKQLVKINSLYELGIARSPQEPEKFIKEKVQQITGLPISYYAAIDVFGLEKIIDSFGGVDIQVKKAIADPSFPGPNYSYEPFYLSAGMHHLNGHDAVRFARSRYAPRGDFERIGRQQQLLDVLKDKVKAQSISAQQAAALFANIKDHLVTNVSPADIPSLLASALDFGKGPIISFTIETGPQGLLVSNHAITGAYTMIPKAGSEKYEAIQTFITKTINQPSANNRETRYKDTNNIQWSNFKYTSFLRFKLVYRISLKCLLCKEDALSLITSFIFKS